MCNIGGSLWLLISEMAGITESYRSPKLRVEFVAVEVVAVSAFLIAAASSDVPDAILALLFFAAMAIQSVLFYRLGQAREKLDGGRSYRQK